MSTNQKNSSYGGTVPKETLNLWNTNGASKTAGGKITETCTIHTKPTETTKETRKASRKHNKHSR